MIAEITGSNVIRSAGSITSCGKHYSFAHLDVRSLQVPAQRDGFKKEIGKTASARGGAEIGDARILGRNIRVERAGCGCKDKSHAEVSVQNFEVRYVIEEIFNCPDVVVACDRNSAALCVIECVREIVDIDVDVTKPRGRHNSRIESHLARHPLRLLLASQGRCPVQKEEGKEETRDANLSRHSVRLSHGGILEDGGQAWPASICPIEKSRAREK